jgi:hypothetical protein
MEATIEVDFRVDQIELRNERQVLDFDKTYERAVEVSGRGHITDPFSIRIADKLNLVGLPGLVTLRGRDAFTRPQSDKNGDILGFIRYDEEMKPIGSFEGSPDRFVIQIFFDLNLLASFAPAIRPGDKLKLVLTVHELESSSLPDGYAWPSSTVQDYGAILVYGFSVKLGINRN